MLRSIHTMLQAFEKNNIKYCQWKSNEHLEEALSGDTDLDILFLPEQRNKLEKILNECGLKRFRALPLMQYNAIEDFIGFDSETAKIWHLHLHYQMTLGEKHLKGYTITPWTNYVLDKRVWDGQGIYRSSCEVELVLLIVRSALKKRIRDLNKNIGAEDLKEYHWLINRIDQNALKLAAEQMTDEKTAKIIVELCNSDWKRKNQFSKLKKRLRKILKQFTGYSGLGSRYARTQRELFWILGGIRRRLGIESVIPRRRISPSGGCVIALLGCDGAGKSTILAYIKNEFKKKLDVYTIYFGSGNGNCSLLRKPMRFVANRVGGRGLGHSVNAEYNDCEKKRISFKARIYSFLKLIWAMTLALEKKKKLSKMTKARNKGMLVLTDRYPQIEITGCSDGPLLTKYADGKGILKKISDWEYHIYRTAYMNPPDLIIKLMVPVETALERKPEMSMEEIEKKTNAVRAVNCSRHSIIINTSKDKTESYREVMEEIWKLV